MPDTPPRNRLVGWDRSAKKPGLSMATFSTGICKRLRSALMATGMWSSSKMKSNNMATMSIVTAVIPPACFALSDSRTRRIWLTIGALPIGPATCCISPSEFISMLLMALMSKSTLPTVPPAIMPVVPEGAIPEPGRGWPGGVSDGLGRELARRCNVSRMLLGMAGVLIICPAAVLGRLVLPPALAVGDAEARASPKMSLFR